MDKPIRFDEVPLAALGSNYRTVNNCNHRSLIFNGKWLECRLCPKQWRDFLGAAEAASQHTTGEHLRGGV